MDEWVISPFESLGPLRFGATAPEVQAAAGGTPTRFQKGASPNLTEAYDEIGFHAYYDSDEKLEFIDAFPPCRVTYAGVDLLRPKMSDATEELASLGLQGRDDRDGSLWFDQHGFGLYAPHGHVEGVSVFRRGYDTGA